MIATLIKPRLITKPVITAMKLRITKKADPSVKNSVASHRGKAAIIIAMVNKIIKYNALCLNLCQPALSAVLVKYLSCEFETGELKLKSGIIVF